jgi:integrase
VGDVRLASGFFKVTTSKRSQTDRMPITADLDTELRRWFAAYEQDAGRPLRDSDFLFPGISAPLFDHYETQVGSGRVLLRTERQVIPEVAMGIQRSVDVVHRALKAAGLPTRYEGTHTIRRAVARAYFDSLRNSVGRDNALREVSALLHHSNSAMTERYLGLSAERDARDDAMRGKPFLSAMLTPVRERGPA